MRPNALLMEFSQLTEADRHHAAQDWLIDAATTKRRQT